MERPLEHGDECEVIDSPAGRRSPNIGLRVTVLKRVHGDLGMDHRLYGPMYRCSGPGIKQLTDAGGYKVTDWADFAGTWLRRIPPVKTDDALTAGKKMAHHD